jgi:L-ascorbate metabolism protein UlaG (beta-lactamase superfamily)
MVSLYSLMSTRLLLGMLIVAGLTAAVVPSKAADGSRCLAMASNPPGALPVRFLPAALSKNEVQITYVTHATFRIESADGTIIATDYAGFAGAGPLPDVATMNHAHETHFTYFPDPQIKHVLRGWNPAGGPARHNLKVGDFLIRNVPTDIRNWIGEREKDGNSIFIFEVAGLCIGHLGHLHHELAPEDLAHIGQLDIVMAPVDGSMTLDHETMVKTLKVLKARLIIPMHAFGPSSLAAFLQRMGTEFALHYTEKSSVAVSADRLPSAPTIMVMPEASIGFSWD